MTEIVELIANLGFPAAIAVLLWFNNRQMVDMLNTHYTTILNTITKKLDENTQRLERLIDKEDNYIC